MQGVRKILSHLAVLTLNPMDIATGKNAKVKVTAEQNNDLVEILELDNLFHLLKRDLMLVSTIWILIILGSMQMIKKTEVLGEKKESILHVLKIVFYASSLLWILECVVGVFDYIF